MVIYPDGSFRKLVNPLAYCLRACYGWHGTYLKRLYYSQAYPFVNVIYVLADGRTVLDVWGDLGCLKVFMQIMNRTFKGVPMIEF